MKNSLAWTALLSVLFAACTIRDKQPVAPPCVREPYDSALRLIRQGEALLKDGDMVVRTGTELSSQFIREFNRQDKRYSHAGLVFHRDGHPFVYHIVPEAENPEGRLKADSFLRFCNPRRTAGFGIYRFDMTEAEIGSLKQQVEGWLAKGVRFDSAFNFNNDELMYCSELVSKGVSRATAGRIAFSSTTPTEKEASFFGKQLHLSPAYTRSLKIMAIDNLFLHPHCRSIEHYAFSPQP
ncbi:MAG TPA: hypothetical protein VFR58_12415 [Flavisolibacter sp.]|nr:hypothetical protein [Flavisolibacter sp.]